MKKNKHETYIKNHFKRILAIGPHPDDVELGCYGALAKFSAEGSKVLSLVLTYGGVGGDQETRKKEAIASARVLGCDIAFGELKDTEISEGQETIRVIEAAIKKFKPTAVFINSKNDTHQDHRNAALAAISAARFVPCVLFYQTPSSNRSFDPKVYIDVTDFIDKKLAGVKLHKSQGNNVYMADRAVRGLSEFLGFQIYKGDRYFEGFEIHQMII